MLPHKFQTSYDIIIRPYEGVNTGVDQPIRQRTTT